MAAEDRILLQVNYIIIIILLRVELIYSMSGYFKHHLIGIKWKEQNRNIINFTSDS